MLPREVFTCRPQKPPSRSKVSRFGVRASNDSCAAGSPSAGKKRSKPPLSRNILSCSFVSRLADGSISISTHRLPATSRGPNPLVFSSTRVRPAEARSSCRR